MKKKQKPHLRPPAVVTEQRRAKAVELVTTQGKSINEAADIIGIHPVSVSLLLRQLRDNMSAATQAEYEVYRKGQLSILELIESNLVEGRLAPDIAREWRAVRSDIAKLLGLNAPERSVAMRVEADPVKVGLYQRFLAETRWVAEEDFEQLWMFCQRMSAPPKPEQLELLEITEEPNPIEGGE